MMDIKTLQVGRNGLNDHHNEDLVLVHQSPRGWILAAIDGITSLTPWRGEVIMDDAAVKVSSGWIAARVVAKNLMTLQAGQSFADLLRGIVTDWNTQRAIHDVPENEILGAVFCAYVKLGDQPAEFWQLGDCGWGVMTAGEAPEWRDSLNGALPDNSEDANVRAETILPELAKLGGVYPDNVVNNPEALAALASHGWATMKEQRRRTSDYSWLTDIDAMLAHEHVKEPVRVPDGLSRMVLTTDGTLIIPQSIEEGLTFLATLRAQDPLMIGLNQLELRTAKGFVDMADGSIRPHTDDLGIIEVTF